MAGRVEESKGVGYRYFRNTGFVGLRPGVDLQRGFLFVFIYLFITVLDSLLQGLSLVAPSRGCSVVMVHGLLVVPAFLVEHRLWGTCGLQ